MDTEPLLGEKKEKLSALQWGYGIAAVILFVYSAIVVILELITSPIRRGFLVNYTAPALVVNSNVFLVAGHVALILHFVAAFAWTTEFENEVMSGHRPLRWIAHGLYMTFYITALGLLVPFPDVITLFTVAVLGGFALAFYQSQSEASNAKGYPMVKSAKVELSFFNNSKGDSQWEGFLVATLTFGVLVGAFIAYAALKTNGSVLADSAEEAATWWIPMVAAILYALMHFLTIGFTVWGSWSTVAKEWFFLIWEVVLAAFLQTTIYAILGNESFTV